MNDPPPTGRRKVPRIRPCLPFTPPEKADKKIEPGVKSAPPPAAPAAPAGELPTEDVPPAERKTGNPDASSPGYLVTKKKS
jgi:hypothetical protein